MQSKEKNEHKEACPNCKSENTHIIGFGEKYYAYYHCYNCSHDFVTDLSKVINDISEIESQININPHKTLQAI